MFPVEALPVVPGQARGGSFQKEKNYIAQKEFAYRMCARRPTSAMPKSFLCCERAFCGSMVVMFCAMKWSVLMSWCLLRGQVMWWSRHLMRCNGLCCVMSRDAILPCTTKHYSRTTLYYKVLLQYTKYYSSTTLYYKVLLQYYPVLQSTTPELLCTTKYYSNTQSTTPVLLCTTKYYSSTTPVLTCTTKYYSNTTLYYKALLQNYSVLQSTTPIHKVLLQYYSVLQSTTPILLCTTKYYSNTAPYYKYYSVLLQYYLVLQSTTQVLLCTTPVLLCTTKYYSSTTRYYKVLHDWSASHMKRHLQCAEQQASPSNFTKYCACHAKWISWLIHITYETSFTMRGATVNTLQPHQILRLPRKMNLMIDPHHIWNVIYNARSNRHHPPTSPNTAPATQNESHDWSTSHMKRHLQCAEQQASLQPHQILRLPRKMNLMIDPHHIWNVIYNARSDRNLPPTSPNTAPATQKERHDWSASHMKRHLQ